MPNHVTNRIICTGTAKEIADLQKAMLSKDIDLHSGANLVENFDFNGIIPEPKILTEMANPLRRLDNGRFTLIGGDQGSGETWREATDEEQALIEQLDSEIPYLGILEIKPGEKRVMPLWYDWRVANWGTKWNSYGFKTVDDAARFEFTFDTAWSAPNPILDKLAERFPNVSIDVSWFDEGWCHGGRGKMGHGSDITTSESLYIEPDDDLYEQVYGTRPISEEEMDRNYCAIAFTTTTELRIADNFTCNDVLSVSDDRGYYPIEAVIHHDDPDMTDDELFTIHQVRDRIIARLGL